MKVISRSMVYLAAFALVTASAYAGNCGSSAKMASNSADIVEVAVSNGSFTTLVAAVKAADLVDTLKGDGPFTVFAPTDEAFAKLPEGTVESLLANPDKLREVLLYHVVPGKVTAQQVVGLDSAATAQGSKVQIRVADGSVMIDDASVVSTDIEAANGVIHVIDSVIIPRG